MDWQQDYKFPDLFDLVNKLVKKYDKKAPEGTTQECVINSFLSKLGYPLIDKIEDVKVINNLSGIVYGKRITLTNGDVYVTVVDKKYVDQESGYGCNYCKWKKVK